MDKIRFFYQGKVNNKMNKHCYIAILFLLTLLSLPQIVLSQQEERLAVVSEYEGDVKVEHESISKTVKKIGNRIRNSAVYEDDSVMTMHNSTADLVFNDNTSLEIDEDTSLTVCSRHMTADECSEGGFIKQVSGGQNGIVRNINIKAGKFLANITPSKSVLTEFETPSGVASVRGTKFAFAYIGGVTSIDLTQGLIDFASAGNEVSFSIEPGVAVNISTPESGRASVHVDRGQLDVRVSSGSINVESGETAGVQVDEETGEITISSEEGVVELETGTGTVSIEEGGSLEATVNAETGEVEVTGVEGEVTITNEDGTTTEVEAGTSLGTQDPTETAFSAKIMKGGKKDMPGEDASEDSVFVGGDKFVKDGDGFIVDDGFIGGDFIGGGGLFVGNGSAGALKDFANSSAGNVTEKVRTSTGSVPTGWTENNSWTSKKNAYTDTVFGKDSNGNNIVAPGSNSNTTNGTLQSGFSSVESFGSNANFAVLHTGFAGAEDNGFLKMTFTASSLGSIQTIFDYNFVTGEFGSSIKNDAFIVKLISSDSSERVLLNEEAFFSTLTSVSDLPGDTMETATGGATGWTTFDQTFTVLAGLTTLLFDISDASDNRIDSAALLDNIGLYFTAAPESISQDQTVWGATHTTSTTPTNATVGAWDRTQNIASGATQATSTYTTTDFFTGTGGVAPGISTSKTTSAATLFENFGNNANIAVVHTGYSVPEKTGYLKIDITFDVPGTLQTIFNYNFITTETSSGRTAQDDRFLVTMVENSNTVTSLLRESKNDSTLTSVTGLPDDVLDQEAGFQTGWKTLDRTYTVPKDKTITLLFDVTGAGSNDDYDTATLLDNIGLYFTANAEGAANIQDWRRADWTANETWTSRKNAYTTNTFGNITPPTPGTHKSNAVFADNFGTNDGGDNNFAVIHTGGLQSDGTTPQNRGTLKWDFTVAAGEGARNISFDYNFITGENGGVNSLRDFFRAQILDSNGDEVDELAIQYMNKDTFNTDFSSVSGTTSEKLEFSETLDVSTLYQTGWKSYNDSTELAVGTYTLLFSVFEADNTGNYYYTKDQDGKFTTDVNGDYIPYDPYWDNHATNDSALLLDNVIDPPVTASSTAYLLTFARMLRGEIDVHDADLAADAVHSEEHQAFLAKVNDVISDMENISITEFIDSRDVFFDRLQSARAIVAGHEETTEFTQQTAVAHHLLEAAVMTRHGLTSNITAITDSLNQAKTFLAAHINDFGAVDALANIKTNIDSVLANIDNINNNVYSTSTLVAVREGIKQVFSDTIDHMNGANPIVCNDPTLPCYTMSM